MIKATILVYHNKAHPLTVSLPSVAYVDTLRLFAAGEADTQGEGAALAAGERAEVGSVDVVDHGVRVQAVEDVHGFDARGPEIATEGEFLFNSQIEACVGRKAQTVLWTDRL